jgi:hypothetical protein
MGCNSIESLQKLMEVITAAYQTLGKEQTKASYDKKLAASGAFTLNNKACPNARGTRSCAGTTLVVN